MNAVRGSKSQRRRNEKKQARKIKDGMIQRMCKLGDQSGTNEDSATENS